MVLNTNEKRNYLVWFAILIAVILIFFETRLNHNGRVGHYYWDTPILIDGSYRILKGQIPHTDFFSPIGAGNFVIGYIGFLCLDEVSIKAIDFGILSFSSLVILSSFIFLSFFLKPVQSFFISILQLSYLFSTRLLGYGSGDVGYVGIYNLFCYCICIPIFMISIFMILGDNIKQSKVNFFSFIFGFLTSILLFIKFSFIPIIIIAFFPILLISKNRIYSIFLFLFGVSIILMLTLLQGFILIDFFRDINIVKLNRQGYFDFFSSETYTNILFLEDSSYLMSFVALLIFTLFYFVTKDRVSRYKKILLLFVICSLYSFAFAFANIAITQLPETVCLYFLPITLYYCYVNFTENLDYKYYITKVLLGIISILILIEPISKNTLVILELYLRKPKVYNEFLSDYEILSDWKPQLKEGLDLIIQYTTSDYKVMTIDYPNFVSYILLREPPKNQLLYWHYGMTFNDSTVDKIDIYKPDHLFSDTDAI